MDFFKILGLGFLGIIVLILLFNSFDSQPIADVVNITGETIFSNPLLLGISCLMLILLGVFVLANLIKSQR